jgi:cell division protein FtsN
MGIAASSTGRCGTRRFGSGSVYVVVAAVAAVVVAVVVTLVVAVPITTSPSHIPSANGVE